MKKVICLVMLVSFVGWSAGSDFHNGGGDGRWDNPLNWSDGVPQSNDGAFILNGNTALIDSATTAYGYNIHIGAYGAVSGVNMTGGSLTVGNWGLNIGRGGNGDTNHTGSEGTFQMSGGVLTADYVNLPQMWGTSPLIKGYWLMEGGTANVGWMKIGGDNGLGDGLLELYGGTINLSSHLEMTAGFMDITDGIMNVSGGLEPLITQGTIQQYIDDGWIYSSLGGVLMEYDDPSNTITLTGVPEPATMSLLLMGGLLLRRKK